MKTNYVKAIIGDATVCAVEMKNTVNRAIKMHRLSPTAAEALARTLAAAALCGKQLKNEGDYLTVTVNGGGPLGTVTACSDGKGNVKGMVANGNADVFGADGKPDIPAAVGKNGKITVMKNVGLKQPYIGTSELVSGQIIEDFAHYFAISEQQPCAFTAGFSFGKGGNCLSGGAVLVQVLPNCPEELVEKLETTFYAMDEMSYQFKTKSVREVVETFFGGYEGFTVAEEGVVRYRCDCSQKRIERVIKGLGREEAEKILDEQGVIQVECRFCDKKYIFDREKTEKLFESK